MDGGQKKGVSPFFSRFSPDRRAHVPALQNLATDCLGRLLKDRVESGLPSSQQLMMQCKEKLTDFVEVTFITLNILSPGQKALKAIF